MSAFVISAAHLDALVQSAIVAATAPKRHHPGELRQRNRDRLGSPRPKRAKRPGLHAMS